jgi:hypothetical protein
MGSVLIEYGNRKQFCYNIGLPLIDTAEVVGPRGVKITNGTLKYP